VFGIFLNRKNVIVILMSVELILLAVNINLVAFSASGRSVGPGLRAAGPDGRRRRGGHRPRHPRRLLPQPRLHRGRRRQHDEGLTGNVITPSSSCRSRRADRAGCSAASSARGQRIVTTGRPDASRVLSWIVLHRSARRRRCRGRALHAKATKVEVLRWITSALQRSTGRCASTR
jgi:hypothetical protein